MDSKGLNGKMSYSHHASKELYLSLCIVEILNNYTQYYALWQERIEMKELSKEDNRGDVKYTKFMHIVNRKIL